MDTGFHGEDARTDYRKAKRRASLSRLANRLAGRPKELSMVLPFDEVVGALGRTGERRLGNETIELTSIVGSVDRTGDFDRSFRPVSRSVRGRWERMAEAMRRGQSFPPIKVYRVGGLHFVEDGHHRVSVARALGRDVIEARVTEVYTRVAPGGELRLADLPLRSHRRVFLERVPLPADAQPEVRLSDPWRYAELAEGVEAWGYRAMQDRGDLMDRAETARAWLTEEFRPVVEMIDEGGLRDQETAADAFMRLSSQRYRLLRTHDWDDETLARVREEA
jgi:hypothetical protein